MNNVQDLRDKFVAGRTLPGTSRRSFLQTSLAALVATTATPIAQAKRSADAGTIARPVGKAVGGDFTFFHLSDSHIDPRLSSQTFDPAGRSVHALRWIADSTGREIEQSQYQIRAEAPHFALHTGDVFEYSVIDRTWGDWESAATKFKCPIAPMPGNHDNTWGEINRELRKRFGNDSYSFDYGGCHFVCLNSAGLLDPLPAWDRRTLTWLEHDLAKVDRQTPVFLAMHHPLSDDAGYASAFDKLRLWNVIQHHNIVLAMDGHWHTVHQRTWQDFDRVNGGATFGVHTGYNSVTVRDDVLRVVFHYWQENESRPRELNQVALVEKPIVRQPRQRPFTVKPVAKERVDFGEPVQCTVRLKPGGQVSATAWIDEAAKTPAPLAGTARRLSTRLATDKLIPGWHFVTTRVQPANEASLEFADSFWLNPAAEAPYSVVHYQGAAAIKTQPIVLGDTVVVGDTAGQVTALSLGLKPRWTFATDSQIVHSVAVAGDVIVVGDVDGVVHGIDAASGSRLWRTELPNAIYAPAAIAGDRAVVADSGGLMHSLDLKTGSPGWSQKVAEFGFEARPVVHEDLILAGAWDARLYALRIGSGELAWQAWCPSWHANQKGRYYAAADASPVIVNGQVLIADRGYRLGRYSLLGEFQDIVRPQVAAVASNPQGDAFYTRGLDNRLVKYAANGTKLWNHSTPLGRAPTPPVVCGSRVAAVSDKGHLCVVDDATGKELFSLSVSPSLFVLSGVGSDGNTHLFTADMDGRLTAIQIL